MAVLVAAIVSAHVAAAGTAQDRSAAARCAFLRSQGYQDCRSPSGFEVEHTVALSDGGADGPGNMTLMRVDAHKEKTAQEAGRAAYFRAGCTAGCSGDDLATCQLCDLSRMPLRAEGLYRGKVRHVLPDGRLSVDVMVARRPVRYIIDLAGTTPPDQGKQLRRYRRFLRQHLANSELHFQVAETRAAEAGSAFMMPDLGPDRASRNWNAVLVEKGYARVAQEGSVAPTVQSFISLYAPRYQEALRNGIGLWRNGREHKQLLAEQRQEARRRRAEERQAEREAEQAERAEQQADDDNDPCPPGYEWVDDYYRANGTFVRGYCRRS